MGHSITEIYGDTSRRVVERYSRVAVAGNGIVAASTFDLVEGAIVANVRCASHSVSRRNVRIREIASRNAFDGSEGIVSDRGVALDGSSGEIDGYSAGQGILRRGAVHCAVEAVAAVNQVVAAASEEVLAPVTAQQGIVEAGPTDRVDAAVHRVCTNVGIISNGAVGGSQLKIDGHGRQRKIIVDAGIAVAENGIVAAHTLELIERAGVAHIQRAGRAEANGGVSIVELRTANNFDGSECIGAYRCIARDDTGGEVHGDRAGNHARVEEVVVADDVKSIAAIYCVISHAAVEEIYVRCTVCSKQGIVEIRPYRSVNELECVNVDMSRIVGRNPLSAAGPQ